MYNFQLIGSWEMELSFFSSHKKKKQKSTVYGSLLTNGKLTQNLYWKMVPCIEFGVYTMLFSCFTYHHNFSSPPFRSALVWYHEEAKSVDDFVIPLSIGSTKKSIQWKMPTQTAVEIRVYRGRKRNQIFYRGFKKCRVTSLVASSSWYWFMTSCTFAIQELRDF